MNLDKAFIGKSQIARIYHKKNLVFVNHTADKLSLWYDFKVNPEPSKERDTIEDLSNSGNNGELLNFSFEEGSGYQDDGLMFDGVDDCISLTSAIIPKISPFTIECWFLAPETGEDTNMIITQWTGGIAGRTYLGIANNIIRCQIAGNSRLDTSNLAYTPNEWNHLTVSRDVDGVCLFYMNGKHVHSSIQPGNIENTDTQIGVSGDNRFYYRGLLGNLRIYNRVLSTSEIFYSYEVLKGRFL